MAMLGGMGRMIKDARKLVGKNKKRKPPKRFDAMTEGRKVSQAKKRIKNKKSKEAVFAEIGRIMKEAGIGQKQKTEPMREGKMYGGEMKKKKGMMGGGKMYTSMNKRYANGGKIYPSKGKS
jgi:hypothetical protein